MGVCVRASSSICAHRRSLVYCVRVCVSVVCVGNVGVSDATLAPFGTVRLNDNDADRVDFLINSSIRFEFETKKTKYVYFWPS